MKGYNFDIVFYTKRSGHRTKKYAYEYYKLAKICTKCFTTKGRIVVHHRNENPCDEREENLQILCNSCHTAHHNIGNTNMKGKAHSKETKEKMSKSKLGNTNALGVKHKTRTQEHCRKISEAKKGSIPWNKGKKGLQESWCKGKKMPKEFGEKISKAKTKIIKDGMTYKEWIASGRSFNSFYKK